MKVTKPTTTLTLQNCKRFLYAAGAVIFLITILGYGGSHSDECTTAHRRLPQGGAEKIKEEKSQEIPLQENGAPHVDVHLMPEVLYTEAMRRKEESVPQSQRKNDAQMSVDKNGRVELTGLTGDQRSLNGERGYLIRPDHSSTPCQECSQLRKHQKKRETLTGRKNKKSRYQCNKKIRAWKEKLGEVCPACNVPVALDHKKVSMGPEMGPETRWAMQLDNGKIVKVKSSELKQMKGLFVSGASLDVANGFYRTRQPEEGPPAKSNLSIKEWMEKCNGVAWYSHVENGDNTWIHFVVGEKFDDICGATEDCDGDKKVNGKCPTCKEDWVDWQSPDEWSLSGFHCVDGVEQNGIEWLYKPPEVDGMMIIHDKFEWIEVHGLGKPDHFATVNAAFE